MPKFIYFGGNALSPKSNLAIKDTLALNSNYTLLSNTNLHDSVTIAKIDIDLKSRNYLSQLGLKPEVIVNIISKTENNSIIIAIKDKHIGLGSSVARRIIVTEVNI